MSRIRHRCWIVGLLLLGATTAELTADTAAPVAVLDFSVPAAESNRWAWAQGGMADLLQIELQRQGVPQLDRDLIHAVLKEQRLAADGLAARDYLALAGLLNVRYLISGRVVPLADGRLRVEVSAFSVETVETALNAADEGGFPSELTPMLRRLAREVAESLKRRGVSDEPSASASSAPKPEALIMFYRGLNACASGQPEVAVAWFMNAASLDAEFTIPLLWEIKAYEMAGFAPHADVRREEVATTFGELGVEAVGGTNPSTAVAKPVVAVLDPVISMPGAGVQAASLGAEIIHALLATDRVRVFAFQSLGAAVAEQDLKLSGLFASQQAPRYGRWLATDGLVLCRVSPTANDQAALELSLVDPLTGTVQFQVERTGPASALASLIQGATGDLLAGWSGDSAGVSPTSLVPDLSPVTGSDATEELRPVYRGLVEALARVQREPQKSDSHRALADAFAATGRLKLAAYEINQCLKTLDIHAPKADTTYLGTHRWLFWEPSSASRAAGLADPQLIANMIGQLLDSYPDSLAAGCLRYNLAVSAWREQRWSEAIAQAAKSRQVLRPLIAQYDRVAGAGVNKGNLDCEVAAATYFLEGSSLGKLGRIEEAVAVFQAGLAFMDEDQVRDVCLPYGPMIGDFFGPQRVYGYGGDPPGIKTRIEKELTVLEGRPYPPPETSPTVTVPPVTPEDPDSGPTWVKRGQHEVQQGNYRQALDCFQTAVAKGITPAQCPGLSTALVELALEQDLSDPAAAAQRMRKELGLVPGEASWVEWFAAGRKHQTSPAYDYAKAAACYRSTIQFLEDPGKNGFYRLEKELCCDRYNLRWGPSLGEVDLLWTRGFDERYYSAAFYLAECLIALDQKEQAAEWLRRIAIEVGGDDAVVLLTRSDWSSSAWSGGNLGVRAARMLEELHVAVAKPGFGDADGPYRLPRIGPKPRLAEVPALPPIDPSALRELTNLLVQAEQVASAEHRMELLQSYVQEQGHAGVPALLSLVTNSGSAWDLSALVWMLEQTATESDAAWLVPVCRQHWDLISLSWKLAPDATAEALAEEWRVRMGPGFVPPDFIRAIIKAQVRPLYPLILESVGEKQINHHANVFLMNDVVRQEDSAELEEAFRAALSQCLKTKIKHQDHYELTRISRIALHHGVPEAIQALVLAEGSDPTQLLKDVRPYMALPATDAEALALLRSRTTKWQWQAEQARFCLANAEGSNP